MVEAELDLRGRCLCADDAPGRPEQSLLMDSRQQAPPLRGAALRSSLPTGIASATHCPDGLSAEAISGFASGSTVNTRYGYQEEMKVGHNPHSRTA